MNNDLTTSKWNSPTPIMMGILILGLVGSSLMSISSKPKTSSDKPYGITVTGHSELMANPDTAYVSLGVVTREKKTRDAVEKNTLISNNIKSAVKGLGIEIKDIQTRNYSIEPWIKYTGNDSKQLGYVVNNTIRVTVRDIKKVSDVVDAGTRAGANSVQGVRFEIGDDASFQRRVLASAVDDAHKKAEAVAKSLGVKAGKPLEISEDTASDYGDDYGEPVAAFADDAMPMVRKTPINPGQIRVTKDAQVTFEIVR